MTEHQQPNIDIRDYWRSLQQTRPLTDVSFEEQERVLIEMVNATLTRFLTPRESWVARAGIGLVDDGRVRSIDEIAEELGIKPKTAQAIDRRAARKIRSVFPQIREELGFAELKPHS